MCIAADFTAFKEALVSEETKVTTNSGNWHHLHPMKKRLTKLACFEQQRWVSIAKDMVKEFDRLEKIPVKFDGAGDQEEMFKEHLEAAKYIKEKLKKFNTSKKVKAQWRALKMRITALKYRIEEVNGGADQGAYCQEDFEELEEFLKNWKENYPLYQDTSISESELKKLAEATAYPKFVKLLKSDKSLRNQFFRWVIRDNNSVDTFVQYPSTCKRLKTAHMSGRINRLLKNFKFIAKEEEGKIFRLPFQVQEEGELKTRNISILDETLRVNLRGNYELSIAEVMNIFQKKNEDVGNLEFVGKGIANWHTLEHGWWDPEAQDYQRIDVETENSMFWKQLPEYERLTIKDVTERYGVKNVQKGQWIAVAKSTRESLKLDIDRSHGYFEILIPDERTGEYLLYPFGKFAKEFPKNLIDKFLFVTNTVESRIEYPDENTFYSHRQQASAPFVISHNQGLELMEMIRKDLKTAHDGNMVFQFAWENCAWWPQQRLEDLLGAKRAEDEGAEEVGEVPNLFVEKLLKSKPKAQPLKFIFSACAILPDCVQNTVAKIIAFLLGSFRGKWVFENGNKVFKSMKNSLFKVNCEMYHPIMLHKKIQEGTVTGTVTFGHHFQHQLV